jgi:hypothetical protein
LACAVVSGIASVAADHERRTKHRERFAEILLLEIERRRIRDCADRDASGRFYLQSRGDQ